MRDLLGHLMWSKLLELLKAIFNRVGHRFESFVGQPAAAVAVVVFKAEDDAADVVRELSGPRCGGLRSRRGSRSAPSC